MRVLFVLAAVVLVCGAGGAATNNPYGAHTMLQDQMSPELIVKHLTWVRSLTGPGGYVKQLIYPITKKTAGAAESWKMFVSECYKRDLIPVLRLGGMPGGTGWLKPEPDAPNDWHTMANVIKKVISDLPRSDKRPLYVEVLNEPNLNIEWSGKADPVEYARFFVQVSKAIRSLGDDRIKICNAALSPGGSYDNVKFVEAACEKVPEFVAAFDVWATHPYPFFPPEKNIHDGTLKRGQYGIDLYLDELAVLEKYGRKGVKIIATEGSYGGGPSAENADLNMRAFRDYWSKWPEVLAICPWYFSNPFGENDQTEWVPNSSGTNADGLPTKAHPVYWAVRNLAKPGDSTGCISGKVTEKTLGAAIEGALVKLTPGDVSTTTDAAGVYMFPKLMPGDYAISVRRQHYAAASRNGLKVSAGENTVADVAIPATSTGLLTVTVTDSLADKPISGVSIVTEPGGFEATTDDHGKAELRDLPPAKYELRLSKIGFYPVTASALAVGPNDRASVTLFTTKGSFPRGQSLIGAGDLEGSPGDSVARGWSAEDGKPHPETMAVDHGVRVLGRSSQKIQPNGSSANSIWAISDYGAAKTGKRYRVQVWCRMEKPEGTVRVLGKFFSNSMEPAGEFIGHPVLEAAPGWMKLVAIGTAPEMGQLKEQAGRLQVLLQADLKSGAAWFDGVWAGEEPGE